MGKKTAAFAAAGALLIAACGDDGGDSAFCDDFESLNDGWSQGDIQDRPTEYAEAAAEIDPPSDIADEWNTFVENVSEIGTSAAEIQEEVGDDPEALQEAANEMQETQATLEEAGTAIDQYANDNCDFDVQGAE